MSFNDLYNCRIKLSGNVLAAIAPYMMCSYWSTWLAMRMPASLVTAESHFISEESHDRMAETPEAVLTRTPRFPVSQGNMTHKQTIKTIISKCW